MEEILYAFEPDHGSSYLYLWSSLGAVILGTVGGLLVSKSKQWAYNTRMLVSMLLFFMALLGLVSTVFTAWSIHRQGPILMYGDRLESRQGVIHYPDIADAHLESGRQQVDIGAPGGRGISGKILVITSKKGRVIVLSEDHYPIREIFTRLKQTRQNVKGRE